MRILIAEDDAQVRRTIENLLSDRGHEVTAVEDGRTALRALEENGLPGLVLCDIGLAGMSGIDCNYHGEPDACDIFDGTSSDENNNGIPDECDADLDGSGSVGVGDLLILLANWGPCGDCADCPDDLSGDCSVGVSDLLILLANWG